MQFLNVISVCMILVGGISLTAHLSSQFRVGSGTGESLFIGVGCLAFGLLLLAIANIGIKLNRIQRELKGSDNSDSLMD